VYATPLDRVAVNRDALGENILLGMADRSGGSTIFEATPDIAENLAKEIQSSLAEIRSSQLSQH